MKKASLEMNFGYPIMLTPPSSTNEDSSSPYSGMTSPTYGVEALSMDHDAPHLKIIEQPVDKFRFRYKSEMAGTHGSLCGINSERNRKATFPSVHLCNYSGKAVIRCSLYQCNKGERKPHAHRLIKKYGNEERDDPHDLEVSKENAYQAVFHSMGIIHTAKKHIDDELVRKKMFIKKEQISKLEGFKRDLTIKEKMEVQESAQAEAKMINLNQVCLRFDALINDRGVMREICHPVYSHAINNLKSALTGELKIVRMDHCSSPCVGGKEIFILVEKVTKKNIKIRFVDYDYDDAELWVDYGKFNDLDVHHQYAIVFKTPPYKDTNLEVRKKVYIELYRPSDGAKSDRKEFYYTPRHNVPVGSKRPRVYNSSSSSFSNSSSSLPKVLPGNDSSENVELNDICESSLIKFFNSSDVDQVLQSEDMRSLFEMKLDGASSTVDASIKRYSNLQINTNLIAQEYKELKAFVHSSPSRERCRLRMEVLMKNSEIFHNAIVTGNKEFVRLVMILAKISKPELLNIQNNDGHTGLHLAVIHNNIAIVKFLINFKVNTGIQDCEGNTPLHIAIKEEVSPQIIDCLVEATDKGNIDLENSDGETILHLAVQRDYLNVVKALCKAGADVDSILKTTGRNVLHLAVENSSLQMVKYLLENTKVCAQIKDFKGYNALKMAEVLLNTDKPDTRQIYDILSKHTDIDLEECDVKTEPMSTDEEPMSVIEIKQEFSMEEIDEIYKNVTHIPKPFMTEIVSILNASGSWYDLANLRDLDHLIKTDIIDKENPAENVINIALANGDSVLTIRNFLENLEEYKVVSILDNMAVKMSTLQ